LTVGDSKCCRSELTGELSAVDLSTNCQLLLLTVNG